MRKGQFINMDFDVLRSKLKGRIWEFSSNRVGDDVVSWCTFQDEKLRRIPLNNIKLATSSLRVEIRFKR